MATYKISNYGAEQYNLFFDFERGRYARIIVLRSV